MRQPSVNLLGVCVGECFTTLCETTNQHELDFKTCDQAFFFSGERESVAARESAVGRGEEKNVFFFPSPDRRLSRESVTARESAVGRGEEKKTKVARESAVGRGEEKKHFFLPLSRPPTLALPHFRAPRKKERLIAG